MVWRSFFPKVKIGKKQENPVTWRFLVFIASNEGGALSFFELQSSKDHAGWF